MQHICSSVSSFISNYLPINFNTFGATGDSKLEKQPTEYNVPLYAEEYADKNGQVSIAYDSTKDISSIPDKEKRIKVEMNFNL